MKSQSFYGRYNLGKGESHDNPPTAYFPVNVTYLTGGGNWGLVNHQEDLFISFSIPSTYPKHLGPYRASSVTWQIRRLTEKELWLKTTYTDGRTYFVKFKQ